MKRPPPSGPIATRIVRAIQQMKSARVVNLRAFREGMARATDMQQTVTTREALADFHPMHAVYVAVQNQVSVLAEQLTALPETAKLADLIEAAQAEYMPGGPPMSPLTTSYFTCWAFFDAAVGPHRETLGTCILAIGKLLGMDPSFLALVQIMQNSCMRVYVHEGLAPDGTCQLRDLVSGARAACKKGDVSTRWVPPSVACRSARNSMVCSGGASSTTAAPALSARRRPLRVAFGDLCAAKVIFIKMLWLNPSYNQGAPFNLAAIEAGKKWKETESDE